MTNKPDRQTTEAFLAYLADDLEDSPSISATEKAGRFLRSPQAQGKVVKGDDQAADHILATGIVKYLLLCEGTKSKNEKTGTTNKPHRSNSGQ
jgi:hypothetical protein